MAALATAVAMPHKAAAQENARESRATTEATSPAVSPQTTVFVRNDSWFDVRIYAVNGGRRDRLGTVTGLSSAEFELPDWILTPGERLHLVADPIGGRGGLVSPRLLVTPGDVIEWQLRNNLRLSSVSVWRASLRER